MTDQPTELLLAAIKEFRTKAFAAYELAKAAHASSAKDAQQTVAAAKDFVTTSQVFWSALRIFESTLHYGAWSIRDDWATWNHIGVTNVKPHEEGVYETSAFTWGRHEWSFSLKDKRPSYSGDDTFAMLTVEYDSRTVMELRIVTDHNSDFDNWRLVDVQALVVGPWVALLTEMATKMELAEQHRRLENEAEHVRAQAARIKL